ncbi:MAG TPA: hypothetical protein PL033_08080 [Candidatus Brocadiia bacterium]|nr:hypothetical protein [Candidatus Brocadiia bacterium]
MKIREHLSALLGYLILCCIFFADTLARIRTHIPDELPGTEDAFNYPWTYWWFQKAVDLGKNPFRCDWVFPPGGVDIFYHSHVFLPTMLTYPAGRLFGAVAGYNIMLMLLLAFGAWAFYLFACGCIGQRRAPAFAMGAFFGFAGYFTFKAHCHPNMLGQCFWGGALAVLFDSYARNRFSIRRGIVFSLCFWASFWTSILEAFMLAIDCACLAASWWLVRRRLWSRGGIAAQARFLLPALAGGVSLICLFFAPPASGVYMEPLHAKLSLADALSPHAMGLLASLRGPCNTEFSGSSIPLSLIAMACWGFAVERRKRAIRVMGILAVAMFFLALDPFSIPSRLIGLVPFGRGVRVPGRFLPFALFWIAGLAAVGVKFLLSERGRRLGRRGRLALTGFMLICAVETFPTGSHPSPVRNPAISRTVLDKLDRSRRMLILVRERCQLNDTYQIFFDMPVIHVSYLARNIDQINRWGAAHPILHAINSPLRAQLLENLRGADLERELRELDVAYIFVEQPDLLRLLPIKFHELARCPEGILIEIERTR